MLLRSWAADYFLLFIYTFYNSFFLIRNFLISVFICLSGVNARKYTFFESFIKRMHIFTIYLCTASWDNWTKHLHSHKIEGLSCICKCSFPLYWEILWNFSWIWKNSRSFARITRIYSELCICYEAHIVRLLRLASRYGTYRKLIS